MWNRLLIYIFKTKFLLKWFIDICVFIIHIFLFCSYARLLIKNLKQIISDICVQISVSLGHTFYLNVKVCKFFHLFFHLLLLQLFSIFSKNLKYKAATLTTICTKERKQNGKANDGYMVKISLIIHSMNSTKLTSKELRQPRELFYPIRTHMRETLDYNKEELFKWGARSNELTGKKWKCSD
jgi:hypothetical protein